MSTYNPSANSPIKAQQPTNCPACGQPIQTPVVPMNNAMNRYVNDATGHVAVYNHGDEFITVSGVKLRREDVIKAISEPDVEGAVTPLAGGKQTRTPIKGMKPQAAPGVPASVRVPVVADIPITNMKQVGINPVPAVVIPSAQLATQPVKVQVGVTEGAPEPQ